MKREINFSQALATVVGTVIGGGVFFKISTISAQTGHPSLTLFVWLLAGIVSIASGLTISEIAAAFPVTGGPTKYIEYTYGKIWGFLFGWAQMVIYFPANIGALCVIFAQQFISLFGLSTHLNTFIAISVALLLAMINFIGTRFSTRMQSAATILKLIPLIVIILGGFISKNQIHLTLWPLMSGSKLNFSHALSSGMLSCLFAYDGWMNVTNLAGETKHPEKDLSRAIILGLSIITLVYVLVNYTFMSVLPFNEIKGNENTAFLAATKLFGNVGGKLVTIGILISVYGAINGFFLTGMRVPYTLAHERTLPFADKIGKTNINTGVPTISGLIILGISLIMIFLGTFDLLTDMLVFVMWCFTTMISISVILLRHRDPELKRPYTVPGYPVIPLISISSGIFIIVTTMINEFRLSLIGIGLTLLSLPIYHLMKHRHKTSVKKGS